MPRRTNHVNIHQIGWIQPHCLSSHLEGTLTRFPRALIEITVEFLTPQTKWIHQFFEWWLGGASSSSFTDHAELLQFVTIIPDTDWDDWDLKMRQGMERHDVFDFAVKALPFVFGNGDLFLAILFWTTFCFVDKRYANERLHVKAQVHLDTPVSWIPVLLSEIDRVPAMLMCLPLSLCLDHTKWSTSAVSFDLTLSEAALYRSTRSHPSAWAEEMVLLDLSRFEQVRQVIMETFQDIEVYLNCSLP